MRCALCRDFLKYSAGMQCEDCKYTCHKKCYPKVVTKCISKSNVEMDPDEEKINHRIPHRFEPFSNMGANWCCHCGYLLPIGRKNCRKCSECGESCHAGCAHLVPDFCGMSMERANEILKVSQGIKATQGYRKPTNLTDKTLRTGAPAQQQKAYRPPPIQDPARPPSADPRLSHGQEELSGQQRVSQPQYPPSPDPLKAAKLAATSNVQPPLQQPRPDMPPRSTSSITASEAAVAAMSGSGKRASQPKVPPYSRSSTSTSTDDSTLSGPPGGRTSDGYIESRQEPSQAIQQPQQSRVPGYNPGAYAGYGGVYYSSGPQVHPQVAQQPQPQPPSSHTVPAPPQITVQRNEAPPATQSGSARRIGLEHFNFLAVLGKGNFGKVMLAETKATKKLYAIKVLKKEFIIENDEVESTKSEKRVFLIANKERHPFLLNLHACFQTETRVYFVMEYISGGDLMLHIQRGQFGSKRAQ